MFSFVHTHDVATAITAALDKDVAGSFNIVDDTPVYVHEWLPELARIVGAPAPRRVPAALARVVAGSWGVAFMNRIVGADNSRAPTCTGLAPPLHVVARRIRDRADISVWSSRGSVTR